MSDSLDGLTEAAGWQFLYADTAVDDIEFSWKDNTVRIKFAGQDKESFRLQVEFEDASGHVKSTEVDYMSNQQELSKKEYEARPETDHGYPKR